MHYRTLAGERVSQLGFGMMRLPAAGGTIDLAATTAMVRSAIDRGLNYIDTAWPYHEGRSEEAVGRVLADGGRNKVFLATKSPVWLVQSPADFPRLLDEQLRRLNTDRIDFYLLHALNAGTWSTCQNHDALGFLDRAKAAGKIRHAGFSFHDESPVFHEILSARSWEFCMIQLNYLDRHYQAGLGGLRAAKAQGTDVVVMEPLRGGNLGGPVPAAVQKLWDQAPVRRTAAEWALRWVWNQPEVSLLLSGMGTQAQVDENLATADTARPGALTAQELALVDQAERTYRTLIEVGCTACRYCLPCPQGVDIPRNFAVFNEFAMFDRSEHAKGGYRWIPETARADRCVGCGACLPQCPQNIAIPAELARAAQALG